MIENICTFWLKIPTCSAFTWLVRFNIVSYFLIKNTNMFGLYVGSFVLTLSHVAMKPDYKIQRT